MFDYNFWVMIIKLVVFLPFILLLVYVSLKYGGSKLQHMQNGRYIKVLERVAISKENSLVVVRIGEKGYVLTSSAGKVETLLEIGDEELKKMEGSNQIPQYTSFKEFYQKVFKKKDD